MEGMGGESQKGMGWKGKGKERKRVKGQGSRDEEGVVVREACGAVCGCADGEAERPISGGTLFVADKHERYERSEIHLRKQAMVQHGKQARDTSSPGSHRFSTVRCAWPCCDLDPS